jgi:hypothetical protein
VVVEDISGDIWVAGGRTQEVPCSSHDERSASIMDESGGHTTHIRRLSSRPAQDQTYHPSEAILQKYLPGGLESEKASLIMVLPIAQVGRHSGGHRLGYRNN